MDCSLHNAHLLRTRIGLLHCQYYHLLSDGSVHILFPEKESRGCRSNFLVVQLVVVSATAPILHRCPIQISNNFFGRLLTLT